MLSAKFTNGAVEGQNGYLLLRRSLPEVVALFHCLKNDLE
jgi:hypothetical protein